MPPAKQSTTTLFGMNGDTPWQIKTAYIFGIPGLIAMWLVYLMATTLVADLRSHADESIEGIRALTGYARAICLIVSEGPEDRRLCYQLSPEGEN